MPGNVQMSEGELRRTAADIKRHKDECDQIINAIQRAVRVASADWISTGMDSLKQESANDVRILQRLSDDLRDWNPKLNQHAEVAKYVNRPMRSS
jgi:uncharacterized protein YukE